MIFAALPAAWVWSQWLRWRRRKLPAPLRTAISRPRDRVFDLIAAFSALACLAGVFLWISC